MAKFTEQSPAQPPAPVGGLSSEQDYRSLAFRLVPLALLYLAAWFGIPLYESALFAGLLWLAIDFVLRLEKEKRESAIGKSNICSFDLLPANLRWPIFGLCLMTMILPMHSHSQTGQFLPLYSLFLMAGAFGAWLVLNTRLSVVFDSDSIEARGFLYGQDLLLRPKRSWADLYSVKMQWAGTSHTMLRFYFKSGGNFNIPLKRLSDLDLEKLMLSLARYADPLTLNQDVAALQKSVLTVGADNQKLSFTRFWQDEFQNSFAETNFVPLERGHQLQAGLLTVVLPLSTAGAGAVYLCTDKNDKQYVLKELSIACLPDESAKNKHLELFQRESQILARLDHPQIVKVRDSFVEGQRQYILLDFVPGLTLRQLVRLRGPLDQALVVVLVSQVAEILLYLHEFSEPIIHRDLTPDNLLLNEKNSRITLIDFGAANEVALQANSTVIGKQCYIAPEQLRGAACVQSDLFALGATIFFLLTGEDPEPISTSYPSKINDKISSAMNALVANLTATDVERRPQSARLVLDLLEVVRSAIESEKAQ